MDSKLSMQWIWRSTKMGSRYRNILKGLMVSQRINYRKEFSSDWNLMDVVLFSYDNKGKIRMKCSLIFLMY